MVPNFQELELMGAAHLALTYNGLLMRLPTLNRKPIKKFENRTLGLKRTEEVAALVRRMEAEAAKAPAVMAATKAQTTEAPSTQMTKAPSTQMTKAPSITQRCQALIRAGHANDVVWKIVKEEFKLDDGRKYYVSWNRAFMRRRGESV